MSDTSNIELSRERIRRLLRQRTRYPFVAITNRGDAAIKAVLSSLPKDKTLLIPEEGGWISYQRIPREKHLLVEEVRCGDGKLSLEDLRMKLETRACSALLYQNPGGYFAEQPASEIYSTCRDKNCLVIMDVSGAIGTPLCESAAADIFAGSFGESKLVNAGKGGFLACRDEAVFRSIIFTEASDPVILSSIEDHLENLDRRISFLTQRREQVIRDLRDFSILHKNDLGFVVVVVFSSAEEKEKIINYCQQNSLEWTECPRYIRVKRPAISIELKRLEESR
ncbi:hypothetical protein HY496_01985 [Candidatus Woesearchaeota archaeon]|nr:hypothetical protein [Candidatus Woesearchaeota archaeon]